MARARPNAIERPRGAVNAEAYRTLRRLLLRWYGRHGREFPWRSSTATEYVQIVSEVLVQRTRAPVVAEAMPGFVSRYPSWSALGGASLSSVEKELRPLGLWRRRAKALTELGAAMEQLGGKFPESRVEIDALPAVGMYVGNAIELFVHGRAMPLLDVNMARVLRRVFGLASRADVRADRTLRVLAEGLVGCRKPREVNWAVLDLGALVCRPSDPDCGKCPLRNHCRFAAKARRLPIGKRPARGKGSRLRPAGVAPPPTAPARRGS
jgi:A/G-specific adenine glycosylase